MTYVWVLYICGGVSWAGCGSITQTAMPSLEACTKIQSATGIKSGDGYATCRAERSSDAPHHPKEWEFKE